MEKKARKAVKKSSSNNFAEVSKFLKIVSDENRLKILIALNEGEMNVTSIHNKLKLPQNLTSHHISKLKGLDLLSEKREGTFRRYSVNARKLKEFNKLFKDLMRI